MGKGPRTASNVSWVAPLSAFRRDQRTHPFTPKKTTASPGTFLCKPDFYHLFFFIFLSRITSGATVSNPLLTVAIQKQGLNIGQLHFTQKTYREPSSTINTHKLSKVQFSLEVQCSYRPFGPPSLH